MFSRRDRALMRRIVSLPLSIAGGVSRAVEQGISRFGMGRREERVHYEPPNQVLVTPEEWYFLRIFEEQYGFSHPFFYACRFIEALKIAEEEKKFLFVYLHSPEHPYTFPFCSETLGSELVVQFLDANFVSWGAIASRAEGIQMASALKASNFPFCAVVARTSGDSIAVLQQLEGPVSAGELVEIMQRTIEEQGSAFQTSKAAAEERFRADRQLRQEQDAAYNAALQSDKEKARVRDLVIEEAAQTQSIGAAPTKAYTDKPKRNPATTKHSGSKLKETMRESPVKGTAAPGQDPMVTQIQIRFPDGERKEQSFLSTDKIQAIYRYIDSLNKPGIGSYKLISNFPRKVYGFEQLGMTIKDAGLYPRASLFLELLQL